MFSKIIFLPIFLPVILFFIIGCGLKLGEKNKTKNVAELQSASCITQSISHFILFFAGDASAEQVSESLLCLQGVLKDFQTNIRGKNKDAYTADEVSNFISTQVIKSRSNTSAALLMEVMKVKVVLVGGNTELLTKNEINGLIDILARLKPEIIKLAPHMKIITSKWIPDADVAVKEIKFIGAKAAFEGFLNRVGNVLASGERSYELNDLANLVIEALKFSNGKAEVIAKIETLKTLIIQFKKSIIGGDAALTGKEWLPFTRTANEVLFQLQRYKYFYDDLKENQVSEKWKVNQKVVKDVSDLMRDLLIFKESHMFTTSELSALILTAQDLKYLNSKPEQKKFTQKGLVSLFDVLWKNILNPPRRSFG